MNTAQFKSALPIGLLGTAIAVTTLFSNGQLPLSRAMEATAWFNRPTASLTAGSAYTPGALLEGCNHFVYYVTTAGTRQPIYDQDTLAAFGLQARPVVEVDEDTLANLPATDPLTRLVEDKQGNLYWAAQGQLWQVNEWRPAIEAEAYRGLAVSRMDASLAGTLPVHWGLPDGTFLRQGEQLYYFNEGSLIAASADSETPSALDVPAEVLALYPQREAMDMLRTRLNAETYLANIRRGPGLEYEVMGVVSQREEIVVTGRGRPAGWPGT